METGWTEEITKGASFWNAVTLWLMVKIMRLKRVGQVVGLPPATSTGRWVGQQLAGQQGKVDE